MKELVQESTHHTFKTANMFHDPNIDVLVDRLHRADPLWMLLTALTMVGCTMLSMDECFIDTRP